MDTFFELFNKLTKLVHKVVFFEDQDIAVFPFINDGTI